MATSRGGPAVRQFMAALPAAIEDRVLRGAARAAAKVVMDEARDRVESEEVAAALTMTSRVDGSRIVVKITVKAGWTRSLGTWLEYGTAPHFITVHDSQRAGRSIGRINQQLRDAKGDASLVIGGQFVGTTVHHPGARAHPFLRVSLDLKAGEAISTAQSFINARVGPGGFAVGTGPEDAEA